MEVSIVSRHPLQLVALKIVGRRSELSHRVPMAWIQLVQQLEQIPNTLDPDILYGAFPEGDHLSDATHGVYTYCVGVEVTAVGAIPDGMITLTVPAQRYATTRVRGAADAIDAGYLGLFQWLGEQGLASNPDAWGFERYDQRRQRVTPPYERFDYDVFKPLR